MRTIKSYRHTIDTRTVILLALTWPTRSGTRFSHVSLCSGTPNDDDDEDDDDGGDDGGDVGDEGKRGIKQS